MKCYSHVTVYIRKTWRENAGSEDFTAVFMKGKDLSTDLIADNRLILKWIIKKQGMRLGILFIWHRIRMSCGHGSEVSDFIKD
jgi:hypothetical protein